MHNMSQYDIYLASPFFNPEQVEREEYVKKFLKDLGLNVFSPKDNCFLENNASMDQRKSVFDDNINAIQNSKAVFVITNGKDMGTIWEAGYSYAVNKPIIYFAEELTGPFNLMLAQSGVLTLTSRNQLKNILTKGVFYALAESWKINKKQFFEYQGDIE